MRIAALGTARRWVQCGADYSAALYPALGGFWISGLFCTFRLYSTAFPFRGFLSVYSVVFFPCVPCIPWLKKNRGETHGSIEIEMQSASPLRSKTGARKEGFYLSVASSPGEI